GPSVGVTAQERRDLQLVLIEAGELRCHGAAMRIEARLLLLRRPMPGPQAVFGMRHGRNRRRLRNRGLHRWRERRLGRDRSGLVLLASAEADSGEALQQGHPLAERMVLILGGLALAL